MPKFRTKAQNSMIFAIAAKIGVTHDDLREWTFEITKERTDHTSELYFNEAVRIIDRLQGYANADNTPRRTVNYRRAKAGVVSIDTAKQAKLLNELWFKYPHRTQCDLDSICVRVTKLEKPRTTKDFNKVIEAVKAMNKRETTFGGFNKNAEAA